MVADAYAHRKQVGIRQLYNQVPQTAWVNQLQFQLKIGCQWSENQLQTEGLVRRTLGQYVAVCPRLQLTTHTQPISTLSRINCERYIFIKKCVHSFIEVIIIIDYVSAESLYMYVAIQH